MTYSGHTTRTVSTVNQSSREGARVTTIVLHHMASTNLEATLSMWTNATRVGSANYAIGNEGQIIGVVPEEYRSWSLGSTSDGGRGAAFDRHSVTFEIENESTNGWTVSQAAHEATAKVVADLCKRYGIACNRTQILGHREVYTRYGASYATACPGALNMDWIVQRAAALLGQGSSPAAIKTPAGTVQADPEAGWNASSHSTADIQRLVGANPDGIYGPDTTAKVKAWQKVHGLDPDGIFGPLSEAAAWGVPATAPAGLSAPPFPLPAGSYFGPKSGPVQSVSGYFSHSADLKVWQQRMKDRGWIITPDGLYGPETREDAIAFQKEKGLTPDGLIGPVTWAAAWTAPIS